MFLFFVFFFGLTNSILLKIHKNNWLKPQTINLFSSEESNNLFGSEYDIEMSDEEHFYHTLCKINNETNTFENNYIFNIIDHLRNNLLNELKHLELLEEELKKM
jgi:hypothetical protein